MRRELFASLGRISPYVQLELELGLHDDAAGQDPDDDAFIEDVDDEAVMDLSIGPSADDLRPDERVMPRMVLVAYASNVRAGLLRVHAGEAVMDDRGGLHWAWSEELPVRAHAARLRLVQDGAPSGFADAPEPDLDLGVAATPDDEPQAEPDEAPEQHDDQSDA